MENETRQTLIEKEDTIEEKRRAVVITMVLSFVIPFIISILAFYNSQIYPNGTNTVFIYDMKAQFMPIYASLRYLNHSDSSLLYSFFGALGSNSLPTYSAYFLNPISWLTVLFPIEQLPNVLYFITVFKIGICGLTFGCFLLYGIKGKRCLWGIVLLSTCYALMSYNMIYSMCLIWLDVVALTPIVLLGTEKILEDKKGLFFILSLFASLLFCFQLAYMTGIFAVMYLIYRMVATGKIRLKCFVHLCICSLISLGLYMPLFLPVMINIISGRLKTNSEKVSHELIRFPIWKVLGQLLSCQYDTIDTGSLPNIFCGTLTVALTFVFFIKVKKNIGSKIIAFCMIAIFLISFCIIPVDKAWHGFVEPNAFPARYSYAMSCFLLILAYESLLFIDERIVCPKTIQRYIIVGIYLFVCIEQYMNAAYLVASNDVEYKYKLLQEYNTYVENAKDALAHVDKEEFCRISRGDSYYSMNDGMLLGYNGIDYFSSFYDENFMNFMGTLGFSQNEHVLWDTGGTPLSESIFGVKYRLSRQFEYPQYIEKYRNPSLVLWQNDYYLPLGNIMGEGERILNGDLRYADKDEEGNAFAYQEILLDELYGADCNVYENIEYDIEEIKDENARHIKVSFDVTSTHPIWLFCKTPTIEELEAHKIENHEEMESMTKVNGKRIMPVRNSLSTVCTYVGKFEEGDRVIIEASDGQYFGDPCLVYFDEEKCNACLNEIRDKGMTITEHANGRIKGVVNAEQENDCLLLSLPYMKGYRIYVNGVKVDYEAYRSVLVMLKLNKGENAIDISYMPPGLVEGLLIASITLFLLLVYIAFTSKKEAVE